MINFSFILDNIKRFNQNVQQYLGGNYIRAWIEEFICMIVFGCSPDDYFRYEFYRKSNSERNKFITYRKSKKIIKKYNSSPKTEILNNKAKFNSYFSDFIKRDWLQIDTATDIELNTFIAQHGNLIVKPIKGGQGHGIFLWSKENMDLGGSKLNSYSGCIAEEILVQHSKMKKLNPTSVNTIRVLTFKGKIIAAALRIGGDGSIVDNLHSNGICGHIDIQTGVIDVPCIDMRFNKYIYHPMTHEKLVGFEIPLWDLVKTEVIKASHIISEVQYIGWDVAILENSIALIEGNHDPGHDVVQMIAQTGLYRDILQVVN